MGVIRECKVRRDIGNLKYIDRGGLTRKVTSEQTELRLANCGTLGKAFRPQETASTRVGRLGSCLAAKVKTRKPGWTEMTEGQQQG